MVTRKHHYGIAGQPAPAWENIQWWDRDGNPARINLEDYQGKTLVIMGFQSWCPGCHRHGFPALKKMIGHFAGNDQVQFLAVQTVFEGHQLNTPQSTLDWQKKYNLGIPFGHDGIGEGIIPELMRKYRTGGTPWFIVIGPDGKVRFNDFHTKADEAFFDFLSS